MKTLYIKGFGPIKEAKVELRLVNLFIGEQSIGKSTIAKLITILTDHISLCKIVKGGYNLWEMQLKEYDLGIYKDDKYSIEYVMQEDGKRLHLNIKPKSLTSYMLVDGKKIISKKTIVNNIIKLKKIYHEEEFINAINKDPSSKNVVDLFTNSIYIPAERIIYSVLTNLLPAMALANSTVSKNLLRFMVDLGNAKSEFPEFPVPLLDISYKHEASEDLIELKDNKKNIPLAVASSGIQSLIPLLLVLHYAIKKREYSSFVIEEPECNLFPTKQVELLKKLLEMVKDSSRTLTITTHSPYLLSAMNNYLYAGKLVEENGESLKEYLKEVLPENLYISSEDCSVYSLGEDINEGCEYCRSLIDEETGMIDFNSLDAVSEILGNEFESLQLAYLNFKKNQSR